ncbi:MAG: hypothetical protein AAGG48_24375 [Planctomycetota bacterium]
MNQPRTKEDNRAASSRTTKIWIGLSFLLSTALLVWSFTLPFRNNGIRPSDRKGVNGTSISFQGMDAEQVRETAKVLDDELLNLVQEKRVSQRELRPGFREARQHWNQHVQKVQRRVKELAKAEEGSLAAQYRDDLIKSLEDADEPVR